MQSKSCCIAIVWWIGHRNTDTTLNAGSYSPQHLDVRVETFLLDFREHLENVSDEDFEGHRAALIAAKLQRDHSIQDCAQRHWEQIRNRRYALDVQRRTLCCHCSMAQQSPSYKRAQRA